MAIPDKELTRPPYLRVMNRRGSVTTRQNIEESVFVCSILECHSIELWIQGLGGRVEGFAPYEGVCHNGGKVCCDNLCEQIRRTILPLILWHIARVCPFYSVVPRFKPG